MIAWFYKWAAIIGGGLAAIAGALILGYRKGDKAGANTVEVKDAEITQDAVAQRATVDNTVQAAAPGAAQKDLTDKWARD